MKNCLIFFFARAAQLFYSQSFRAFNKLNFVISQNFNGWNSLSWKLSTHFWTKFCNFMCKKWIFRQFFLIFHFLEFIRKYLKKTGQKLSSYANLCSILHSGFTKKNVSIVLIFPTFSSFSERILPNFQILKRLLAWKENRFVKVSN